MNTLFESILSNDLEDEVEQSILISTLINCCDTPPKITIDGSVCYIDDRYCSIWNDDFFKHLANNHITDISCSGMITINSNHGFSNFNISATQIKVTNDKFRSSQYDKVQFTGCRFNATRSSIIFNNSHYLTLKNCKLSAKYTIIYQIDKPKFPGTKFECELVLRYNYNNERELRRLNKYLNLFDPQTIGSDTVIIKEPYPTEKPQLDIYKLLGTQIACEQMVYVTMGTDCDAGFTIEHSFIPRCKYPPIKCKNNIWLSPIGPGYTQFYI